ncbi:hypothetical protein QTI66_00340 [Variovorax sp. J22R133]|uniref:hypothetical protein n=1 Tax=Variovorax brevis TaxID=3053503 RepID=UPI002577240E|nr:hypothetical protein [Variovorax sp. J22R133]MDM0110574.1 hypothetical protein [Variovorax sp. J22R133]
MPLPLKDLVKLNQIIQRIQAGNFDANDVDGLLIKLRGYGRGRDVFLEVAHFVAHADARNQGLAQQSITGFVDSMQYFQEYVSVQRPLNLDEPFPAYIYRLFLSQANLADESRLKADHKMSRGSLIKKIEAAFAVDKRAGTCSLRNRKGGVELRAALHFVTSFIHSRAAFHLRDFHQELKDVMRTQAVLFDEEVWDAQADRMSLAILCLVSNTPFVLANGSRASCAVETENHFRLLSGQRRLPAGDMTSEPTSFGRLMVKGEATVISENKTPLRIAFPLIATDLDPHEHCDPNLFIRDHGTEEFAGCVVEIINFAPDMSLSDDFKLLRIESAVQ